jgi:hypothetical protein
MNTDKLTALIKVRDSRIKQWKSYHRTEASTGVSFASRKKECRISVDRLNQRIKRECESIIESIN